MSDSSSLNPTASEIAEQTLRVIGYTSISDYGSGSLTIGWRKDDYEKLVKAFADNLTTYAAQQVQEATRRTWEEAAKECDERFAAYPLAVFPEPPPGRHGQSRDTCSASMGRRMAQDMAQEFRRRAREVKKS